jgi:HAD superfamily hydrolase (TIGR01509 family)
MLYSRAEHLMTRPAKTSSPPRTLPRAILFDMDGTLTVPDLDYPRIKSEMGVGPGPILESLAALDDSRRREAEAILHRIEDLSAKNSKLNEGCLDLLAWLTTTGLPTALITRNSRASTQTVFDCHNLKMKIIITREDGPFKPSPIPLQTACERLGVNHNEVWMVGDGQHDIDAAHAAGIRSVWISHRQPKTFTADPWLTVADLCELTMILKQLSNAGLEEEICD